MTSIATDRARVLHDIDVERDRQHAKWGKQDHSDGTGSNTQPFERMEWLDDTEAPFQHKTAPELARLAKASTNHLARLGAVTWLDILAEELFEASAESDPAKLRAELIQVAAVAVQWVEIIDEREATR